MEQFSVYVIKSCGNGAFAENFLTSKLDEISVYNTVKESNFNKLVHLQPATIIEIELRNAYFEELLSIAASETCQCNICSDVKINFTFFI